MLAKHVTQSKKGKEQKSLQSGPPSVKGKKEKKAMVKKGEKKLSRISAIGMT